MDIIDLIEELIAHGWNQSDIARRCGVSRMAVSGWRRGKYRPRPELVGVLCELVSKTRKETRDE